MLMVALCITSASLKLLGFLSRGTSKTNSLKLLIFIMKIKMRNEIEAIFSFQRQGHFSSFWAIPRDPARTLNIEPRAQLNSLLHKAPSCQVHPTPALKTDLLQHHRANTCTPCSYHLRGVGKLILDCQGTVMVHFQSRACGCKQGCAAQSWEGRRKSTKTHKAALWPSKSVSELWLLDLQSHRQPLACGIQLLLWDKVWGHWGLKRDPARKVSELQENFLTSL